MQLQQTRNVGRKARIGKVYFINGKLHFFAGYAKCDGCEAETRVLLPRSNAEEFAKLFGGSRTPVGAKVAKRMLRHYGL
jgi:hypothetical protein